MRFLLCTILFLTFSFATFGQQTAPEPEKPISIGDPIFFGYYEADSIKLKNETLDYAARLLVEDIKLSCRVIIFREEKTTKLTFERRKRTLSRFFQKKGIAVKRISFTDGGQSKDYVFVDFSIFPSNLLTDR